jgi:FdrA protein
VAAVSVESVEVRAGSYADSVTLMQVSQRAAAVDGVEAAMVAMATPLNLDLLTRQRFALPTATPNDLVIAIRAADEAALRAGLDAVAAAWRPAPVSIAAQAQVPRTTAGALRRVGREREIVLVSVPGAHAFTEAMDAVNAGADVMIFSDNVPVEQEVTLKEAAERTGALVMGPDCGTAIVDGFGLGFANAVRAGPVGIVAASGTGAQQVSTLLDLAGVGVSAVLGVGGRDMSAQVGARATRAALQRLAADAATEHVVVVSKPPDSAVEAEIRALDLAKPVTFVLLGPGQADLTAGTEDCLRQVGAEIPSWPTWGLARAGAVSGEIRGLFAGGTLCAEAALIAESGRFVDFGDDAMTQGRAHPVIDPSLRLDALRAELADPSCGVVLLDVVLGYGAHPDPAADLADVIEGARPPVLVSLIGTRADPQGLQQQANVLSGAGAEVFASNAQAAQRARELVGDTA